MRAFQAIAVVAVLIVGLGAKLALFPATEAEANRTVAPSLSVGVLETSSDHQNASVLPDEKIHDMTFVYPEKD